MTAVCLRCGEELRLEEKNCSNCGLSREGGKGKIILGDPKSSLRRSKNSKKSDIFDKIKDHKIRYYYDLNLLTNEKLYSEKERIKKRIKEIDKIILSNLKNAPDHLFSEKRRLEEQLETIYHYIVLRDKVKMIEKISKYYDFEALILDKVNDELTQLIKEIREVEDVLIYMESDEPSHPDKMGFYEKRNAIRDQLDTLHDYKELLEMESSLERVKDMKLKSIYGRLPDWRIDEKSNKLKEIK